ncbi:MAG TPA: ABC transporter substrate-binding protein [Thermoanaerobaculia bacterium]|nr:ABC transporter substrate-binding protein [Thermoanaerobaculia bacterium]
MSRRSAALIALLLCFACLRDEQPAQQPSRTPKKPAAAADAGTPQEGGTLVRRIEADVVTLNPITSTSTYDRQVVDYLFTPMVYLDQDLEPIPGLADSWEILEGGRLYRFELNQKATFADGTPVKASDVVFTLKKIFDPTSEALQIIGAFEYLDLARTRAVDDDTVEIGFRQPLAAQLIRFHDVMVLPEHVYSKGKFREDFNSTAVGSGPYRLVKRDPGKEVIIERREDYWREKPPLKRVIFKVISDHATAWNALRRGDIDETRLSSDVWRREHQNPQYANSVDFRRFYTMSYNFIAWNLRTPRLADKRVRQALSMCIPTQSVINDLYYGTARAMSGPFTPDSFAYNPTVPVIRHDLTGAKRLLTNAGWMDSNGDGVVDSKGKPLKIELILMAGNATTLQFGQMLQGEMKKIGVQLELSVLDFSSAIQRIMNGNYEAAYFGYDLDNDPDPFNILHSSQVPPRGQNFAYYANPEIDRIIVQARSEMDRSKRKDLYWRLHEIVAADQPYTFTVQVSSKWGLHKRVRGAEVSGYGLYRWFPGPLGWWIPRDQRAHDRAGQ